MKTKPQFVLALETFFSSVTSTQIKKIKSSEIQEKKRVSGFIRFALF